jgi:catechol 2,3-dioxygenase
VGLETKLDVETQVERVPAIAAATRLGAVRLTVADLDKQIAFHQDVLGFKLNWRENSEAGLGAGGEDLLRFTELKGARRARKATGLYHTAILVPTKWELAQLLRQIAETRTQIQGMTDHGTHLAIYLPDAEGNGLELAWDFPRAKWQPLVEAMRRGDKDALFRASGPVDVEDLLAELEHNPASWRGLDPSTRVGHVHLHVADLPSTRSFYHDVLGFDIMLDSDQFGATFFSAGGYHHHIGGNVWHGVGAPPPSADATGLRQYTVILPSRAELERVVERVRQAGIATEQTEHGVLVRDPSMNAVELISE